MFSKLKDKLKSWAKGFSQKAEASEIKKDEKEKDFKKLKKDSLKLEKQKEMHSTPSFDERLKEKRIEESFKEEEPKLGEQGFFKKIQSKINKIKISEEIFNIYSDELKMLLLENNVAFDVAERIIEELKQELVGKELLKKEIEEEIKDSLKKIIEKILVEPFSLEEKIREKISKTKEPFVILFCGINGSGKTTTIAKIAEFLKNKKISCVMAAADTFRAASIEQIKSHGEKIHVHVVSGNYGADPASVAFDAINYAKKNFLDCVLIDTAGRMHTAKNLMHEIEKISKVCKPDLKLFVGESLTGNDAVEQVKSFDWAINIDGIILTKADVDEKGGTALSLGYTTKKPILFLGTGQQYDAIEVFDKEKFIQRLGL